MTKCLHSTKNLYIYNNKDNDMMIAIEVHPEDTLLKDKAICDWCGKHAPVMFYIPELGDRLMCSLEFSDYRKRAKFYQEDMHTIIDNLIAFVLKSYKILKYTNEELDLIDKYIQSKTNKAYPIRLFIEKYGDSYEQGI